MLKKIASSISTLGPVGRLPFASLITLFLSIPLVFALDVIVWGVTFLYPGIYIALFILFWTVMFLALSSSEELKPQPNSLMLNVMLGFILTFSGIAINTKLLVTGFFLFLFMKHFVPRALRKYAGIDCFVWHPLFGFLVIDIASGFFVNFIFRFIFWLVAMPQ